MTSHINAMMALAHALRSRGHQATFFLLGRGPASVRDAGFRVVEMGGGVFPPDEYQAQLQRLGTLSGRAATRHTVAIGVRATEAILQDGVSVVHDCGVTALVVDQTSFAGGSVADRLGLPYATVCNAVMLNPDPTVPPYFTAWLPRDTWWSRFRNQVGWAVIDRLTAPMMQRIRAFRSRQGLSFQSRITETWSNVAQISQTPQAFEFPKRKLPESFWFVGPLRWPDDGPSVPFPFEQLDGRPLVYASLGTLVNRAVDTFRMIAEACAGLEVQLVITTAGGLVPADLGPLPGRRIVVGYAPQVEVIRRSSLVVTHGGLNTVLDALSAGVPMVVVPFTNDQPGVAARVVASGTGAMLPLKKITAHRLRAKVQRVRGDLAYQVATQRMAGAIRDSGGAPRASQVLEQRLALNA